MRLDRFEKQVLGFVGICILLLTATCLVFGECGGVERWAIKTLQDGVVLPLVPVNTTVKEQSELTRPEGGWLKMPRQKDESVYYRITGMITWAGMESDHDYHLVLSDGRRTMVCEIPDPDCLPPDNSHAGLYRAARHVIDSAIGRPLRGSIRKIVPISVELCGVGFWEKPDHGTGHSINGREIHPVLFVKPLGD